jgi:hypothetical protein
MSGLHIDITDHQQSFFPGQVLSGTVYWDNQVSAKDVTLRLLWYTEGRGTEDIGIVETMDFPAAQLTNRYSFEFSLPIGPYSFSGHLISLVWALELQVDKEWLRKEFILSPTGSEILLEASAHDPG